MGNYFKQLNEAFDKKYGFNRVVSSKSRNLVETAEADWDWYEDGFTSPLYRLYGQAFEEAGFDEHADVQSGMGEVYISKKGDPEGMFVANFEDVNDFMNRIHTSMVQGKLTDEKRIKEIIFQGVLDISRWRDYPDFENSNESFKTSKRRKLTEATTSYDWYENGDNHPFLDLYDSAAEELGVYAEPSIQSGKGAVTLYSNGKDVGWIDYEDERRFMNDLYAKYESGKISEQDAKDAIYSFINQHIDYERINSDEMDDDDRESEDNIVTKNTARGNYSYYDFVKFLEPKFNQYMQESGYESSFSYSTEDFWVYLEEGDIIASILKVPVRNIIKMIRSKNIDIMDKSLKDSQLRQVFDQTITKLIKSESGSNWKLSLDSVDELSLYKREDCSYLNEIYPDKKIKYIEVLHIKFENGSFIDFPSVLLDYRTRDSLFYAVVNQDEQVIYSGDDLMSAYLAVEKNTEVQESYVKSKRKLKEAKNDPLTSKPASISNMLLRNKSAIDNADDLNALISAVSAALSSKKDDKKVKEIMAKLNTMPDHAKALTYLYNLILKGDNLGVSGRKKYEGYDDGNNEIDRYQKWVDFDMSRYGKISERTQQMVNKAGYQIIKDDHGDYEVAAGHFE